MRILLTGAGRGLGLSLLREAVKRGHFVYAGIRASSSREQAEKIRRENPDRVELLCFDVQSEDEVERAARLLKEEGKELSCIINNAAYFSGRDVKADKLDINEIEKCMQVNAYGPVRVVKYFLPFLRKAEDACVLNVSSESGSVSMARANDYPYSMSKAALNMFSEQLARSEEHIRVYAVHPGWMFTDMGGKEAPTDPAITAKELIDLIEGKTKISAPYTFMDTLGKELPL